MVRQILALYKLLLYLLLYCIVLYCIVLCVLVSGFITQWYIVRDVQARDRDSIPGCAEYAPTMFS